MKNAISIDAILKKKFKDIDFTGDWLNSFGDPERSGVWIMWGHSGNGKTSFAMQLAKELTNYGKVAYASMEEKTRKTMQKAIIRHNMKEVKKDFILLEDNIEELKERLRKQKSPHIIFIDSYQYTGLTKREYIALKEEFANKLFIFISHAEGKHPEGRAAKFVRYDADIKIRIEGYKAFPVSRFGGGEPFTIWEQGANEYWGEII
jgi:2-phosphoglycerate kinase